MSIIFSLIFTLTIYSYTTCYPSLPSEPSLPKTVCTTLTADLKSSSGKLSQDDDSKADTSRIEAALKACASGSAVKLAMNGTNDAFLTAPITIPSGVTLWVDKGVTLFASRIAKDYEKSSGSCGVAGTANTGCNALITATNTVGSGIVGEGAIDGRGGEVLSGKTTSWWDIAATAKAEGKAQNNPHMIAVNGGSNFLMYKISIHNGPEWQVVPTKVDGFIAWGIKIQSPTSAYSKYTAATAHNTDGIDPVGCSNVVIAHSSINTGDDHIAIKGQGTASKNFIIAHNHFYKGHGVSIGSELFGGNVENILVTDLTLDGADNGIRIKAGADRGAKVDTIRYENICMKSVDNPLVFDAFYSTASGTLYPDFQGIELSGVHITSSGKHIATFKGYDDKYPLKIKLDNVQSDVSLTTTLSHVEITEGPGTVKGLTLSNSTGVKISGSTTTASAISCSFPAFGS